MILRRLTQHVREQNWFAVALDFLIVVIGVFIGLQVSNWNDARSQDARAAHALELLQAEAEQNLATIRARLERRTDLQRLHAIMVRAVNTGWLDEADAPDFERAVTTILFFSRLSVRQSAYRALEQSGDLTLIDDTGLIVELNDFRATLDWTASQQSSFRNGLSQLATHWRPYVIHQPGDRPDRTGVRVALDGLSSDPQAVSALTEVARMHAIYTGYLDALEEQTEHLCARLSGSTGRPCEDLQEPGS